jgi:hypothetical protein
LIGNVFIKQGYLIFKFRQFQFGDIPYNFDIHAEIFVNDKVPEVFYHPPVIIWKLLFKQAKERNNCLSNDDVFP